MSRPASTLDVGFAFLHRKAAAALCVGINSSAFVEGRANTSVPSSKVVELGSVLAYGLDTATCFAGGGGIGAALDCWDGVAIAFAGGQAGSDAFTGGGGIIAGTHVGCPVCGVGGNLPLVAKVFTAATLPFAHEFGRGTPQDLAFLLTRCDSEVEVFSAFTHTTHSIIGDFDGAIDGLAEDS